MERPLDPFERRELIAELLVNTYVSLPPKSVRAIVHTAFSWTYLSDKWLLEQKAKDEAKAHE